MPRGSVLLKRALVLHGPCETPLRALSTVKPGSKQKRDGRTPSSKNPESSNAKTPSDGTLPQQTKKSSSRTKRDNNTTPVVSYKGPPVLIPPGKKYSLESPHPPFDRSKVEAPMAHTLWTVDASPLLDPKAYCRKSAFFGGAPTRNGTLAARRLLEGKEKVLEELRRDILKKGRRNPRPYAIMGHGIPKQLLQAHINMAGSLLSFHKNAAEITFRNDAGDLSLETLRIRSRHGKNRVLPWHMTVHWDHDMQLYLTVMNRLSSLLSQVLWPENPIQVDPNENEEDDDDDFVRSSPSAVSDAKPLHWNVEIRRGEVEPLRRDNAREKMESESMLIPALTPVVEWTAAEAASAPGHMCVRLRGLPVTSILPPQRRRPKPVEVTMNFRACFQNESNA